MKILIKAGLLYPVTSKPIKNGYVSIENGKILDVGREPNPKEEFHKAIDLTDYILLPGFINAHSHLQFTGMDGSYKGSLIEWIKSVVGFLSNTPIEKRKEGVARGIKEMMNSGITAVGDIMPDAGLAEPLLQSGLDAVIFLESLSNSNEGACETAGKLEIGLDRLIKAGLAVGLSPHAPHTVSEKLFRRIRKIADDSSIPLTTHIAETPEENDYIKNGKGALADFFASMEIPPAGFKASGLSPTALLDSYSLLENCLAAHLNIVDSSDIEILVKRNVIPLFCPCSSRWFERDAVMPLDKFIKAGLKPALGTDSLASNSSLSMLDELREALKYFPKIPRETFLEMATINGARALGMNSGSIEKGKKANLIAFRLNKSSNDPLDSVFHAQKADFVIASR